VLVVEVLELAVDEKIFVVSPLTCTDVATPIPLSGF